MCELSLEPVESIEFGEGSGEVVDGATEDGDIIWGGEVIGQGSTGGKVFEILSQILPAASSVFMVLNAMKRIL